MTEPAPGAAPEPVTETWTYGGIRADKDGKKWHAWPTRPAKSTGSPAPAIAGWPSAAATPPRSPAATAGRSPCTAPPSTPVPARPGNPRRLVDRAHPGPDPDRVPARRADAARRDALDEAFAPLLELAGPLRTGAQRDALAAYVIRKLHSAWATRKPPGSRQ